MAWQTSGRHKRMVSGDDTGACPWLSAPLASARTSSSSTSASPQSRLGVLGQATNRGPHCALLANREASSGLASNGQSLQGSNDSGGLASSVNMEGILKYRGVKVRVKSSPTGLSWKPAAGAWGWCLEMGSLRAKIPYDEVLGSWTRTRTNRCSCLCLCRTEHQVVVAALQRPRGNPRAWKLQEHVLQASSQEQAKAWVAAITCALQLCYDRPRSLLVFVNPYSGSKRAQRVWQQQAAPVFFKAGIKVTVIETTAADHARSLLASMKADELGQYQGVVAVGGDGVFQECVMGLMAQRGRGGKNTAVAARMRVGHIPGGSTDAVAYTLHGTRSAEAAALHIALGDRMALDVARVDCHNLPPPPPQQPAGTTAHMTAFAVEPGGSAASSITMAAGETLTGDAAAARGSTPCAAPAVGPTRESADDGGYLPPRFETGGGKDCGPGATLNQPTSAAAVQARQAQQPLQQELVAGGKVPTLGGAGGSESVALMGGAAGLDGAGTAGAAVGTEQCNGSSTGSGPGPLSSRYFVCQAAYGFLGDVMKFSERLRFMGPTRYDVSGLVQFLRLRTYPLHISYKPAPLEAADRLRICSTQCEACRMAGIDAPRPTGEVPTLLLPPADALPFSALHHALGALHLHHHHHHPTPPASTTHHHHHHQQGAVSTPAPAVAQDVSSHQQHALIPAGVITQPQCDMPVITGGGGVVTGVTLPASAFGCMASSPLASPPSSALNVGPCSTGSTETARRAGSGALSVSGRAASAQLVGSTPSATKLAAHLRNSASSSKLLVSGGGPPSALCDASLPLPPARQAVTSTSGTATAGGMTSAATTLSIPEGTSSGGGVDPKGISSSGTDAAVTPASPGSGWITIDGEFVSVMAVVTPCRSDKTLSGIIPHAHLSDGRIYLVLVSKCHHLDYLRFLIRLTNKGLDDKCLPFVKVVPVTAAVVRPKQGGPASVWNVDGELLPQPAVSMRVARGMQDVFARGVELGFMC